MQRLVKILRHRIPLPLRYQIAPPIIHCSHYLSAPEASFTHHCGLFALQYFIAHYSRNNTCYQERRCQRCRSRNALVRVNLRSSHINSTRASRYFHRVTFRSSAPARRKRHSYALRLAPVRASVYVYLHV